MDVWIWISRCAHGAHRGTATPSFPRQMRMSRSTDIAAPAGANNMKNPVTRSSVSPLLRMSGSRSCIELNPIYTRSKLVRVMNPTITNTHNTRNAQKNTFVTKSVWGRNANRSGLKPRCVRCTVARLTIACGPK